MYIIKQCKGSKQLRTFKQKEKPIKKFLKFLVEHDDQKKIKVKTSISARSETRITYITILFKSLNSQRKKGISFSARFKFVVEHEYYSPNTIEDIKFYVFKGLKSKNSSILIDLLTINYKEKIIKLIIDKNCYEMRL